MAGPKVTIDDYFSTMKYKDAIKEIRASTADTQLKLIHEPLTSFAFLLCSTRKTIPTRQKKIVRQSKIILICVSFKKFYKQMFTVLGKNIAKMK